ncbi:unnamed protein product [Hymenolepis diminuta]|uniref:Transmembrane protein n=1 Tax=Hymenolepis diminuta TaxID=6216 RepID=A0A0R3SLR0_HYMDI|nr:unnamed protein product [Hymenolepis diminuta]
MRLNAGWTIGEVELGTQRGSWLNQNHATNLPLSIVYRLYLKVCNLPLGLTWTFLLGSVLFKSCSKVLQPAPLSAIPTV